MEEEHKKAIEKAMQLLLYKDRTERELSERLKQTGFSEQAVRAAMEYVESFGYIDDLRYATNYVSFRRESKSRREIIYKLREKGVADNTIEQALEEEYQGEGEAIRNLLGKRLKGKKIEELERRERDKHIAYLCRKGYSYSEIQRALDNL